MGTIIFFLKKRGARRINVYCDSAVCLKLVNQPGVAAAWRCEHATGPQTGQAIAPVRGGTDSGQPYRRLMVALRQDVLPLFDDLAFFHVHSHTGHQHATGNTHADSLARSHSARADPAAAGYLLCARHVPQWVPLGAAPAGDAMNDGGNVAGIAPAAAWSWLSSLSMLNS